MDSKILSEGELELLLEDDEEVKPENKSNIMSWKSLGRQSSIYSLTLDEFQHTVCERGKNFGSMNMDDFLTSIWNAEENQTAINNIEHDVKHNNNNNNNWEASSSCTPNLTTNNNQPSITLPPPLCTKTVDEVWSEICRAEVPPDNNSDKIVNIMAREPTFGEMTLEEFLVKAGIVRENTTITPTPHHQQQFGAYPTCNITNAVYPTPLTSIVDSTTRGGGAGGPSYQTMPPTTLQLSRYSNIKRSNEYQPPPIAPPPPPPPPQRVGFGYDYGPSQLIGGVMPMSPASSHDVCANQLENPGSEYGMEMNVVRSRKRILDGPVERVIERRQRRMIKNRESAARSRARKQAYTVELEVELNEVKVELNEVKEENIHLKRAMVENERNKNKQYLKEMKMKMKARKKGHEKIRMIRRSTTCFF